MTGDAMLDAAMEVMDCAFDPFWNEAWTRTQVRDSLEMPSTSLLLTDAEGRVIREGRAAGFVMARQALDEEELLLIAVRPEDRGRGVGRRLLEVYLESARRRGVRSVFLEMRANNPAHALYRQAGFVPIGTRPRYYRTRDDQQIDAITFSCRL